MLFAANLIPIHLRRTVQMVLVTLFVYVTGVQCCQNTYARAVEPSHTTSSAHRAMSCHQSAPETDEESQPCHCEYNPAQLSWAVHEDMDLIDLKFEWVRYIMVVAFQPIRSLERLAFSAPIRPPPLTLAIFIPSTVLLI